MLSDLKKVEFMFILVWSVIPHSCFIHLQFVLCLSYVPLQTCIYTFTDTQISKNI